MIRSAEPRDASSLAQLYNYYVVNTVTTFEEEPVTGEELAERVEQVQAVGLPWLVMQQGGQLVGYWQRMPG